MISRRRLLTQTTVACGSALLEAEALTAAAEPVSAPPTAAEMNRAYVQQEKYDEIARIPVYRAKIEPHWFGNDLNRFWYRNDGPRNTRAFVRVDAISGTRVPAFDHARVATALNQATGKKYAADQLPFTSIAFSDPDNSLYFRVDGQDWVCNLSSYRCTKATTPLVPAVPPTVVPSSSDDTRNGLAPNKQITAFVRDYNLWIRDESTTVERQLTHDGSATVTYTGINWSPDSHKLVLFRTHPVTVAPVYAVESSPKAVGTRGVLHQHEYAQPGDPFPIHEPWIFDVTTGKGLAAIADPIDFGEEAPDIVWRPDSSGFLYEQIERGHQRFRILAVDVESGKVRTIVDERSSTFLHTSHAYTYYTKDRSDVLYVSEQDGWRHLYLYDGNGGGLRNRITQGKWVVRSVDRVDEATRQIWFQASGRNADENPYHRHFYRVNFDGSGLVALTDGDGTHSVQYSPDQRFLIDTYSRPDLPPVHTLRRVGDSTLVCALETADISGLLAAGWRAPEVFRARGRDNQTDIWGLVFRPLAFQKNKRYPVIENIYAGPHDSFVRQNFAIQDGMQSLAELGFVVVQCDGMGTANRSKAFHDVCWRHLKDAGLPDRIAWIKALAASDPSVDATRVGIYGTSAGGQSSTGAVLFHPEFYKVAVSSCGCHDNRIDKRWWNEQWMGVPVGEWYADSSNITHADKLRGKLMLIVGELDTNVPPESTIRLADALIRADKEFELVVIPGADHTSGGAFGERKRRDFFVRHLLGAPTPDRNLPKPVVHPVLLSARPLDQESLATPDSGPDTTIQFRNLTTGEVKLFWLPGAGDRRPYGIVAAGANRDLHTYRGHFWLVTDKDDHPLGLYVAESRPGIVELR